MTDTAYCVPKAGRDISWRRSICIPHVSRCLTPRGRFGARVKPRLKRVVVAATGVASESDSAQSSQRWRLVVVAARGVASELDSVQSARRWQLVEVAATGVALESGSAQSAQRWKPRGNHPSSQRPNRSVVWWLADPQTEYSHHLRHPSVRQPRELQPISQLPVQHRQSTASLASCFASCVRVIIGRTLKFCNLKSC